MRRLAVWLLRHCLATDVSAQVIGDLVEQPGKGGAWFLAEALSAIWHLRVRATLDRAVPTFVADLTHGARLLWRAPTYTTAAVLTLGLAIGATTSIYSVVDPVLLRPLPYPEPDRLAAVWELDPDGSRDDLGYATYRDLVTESKSMVSAAVIGGWSPTVTRGTDSRRVDGSRVSWGYFRTLGVSPALGRAFLESEDTPDRYEVVVLSYDLWQRGFSGDSSIVGKSIAVDGDPMTVVGVMPQSFYNAPDPDVKIWRALGYDEQPWACRTCHSLRMIARLKPHTTLAEAQAELTRLHQGLERAYPKEYGAIGAAVVPLQDEMTRPYRGALLALAGAVLLMLCVAAANVANLQLARSVRREGEFAVRTALGAGRGRLTAQLLAESVLLSAIGGLAGIVLTQAALPVLVRQLPDQLPRLGDIHLNIRALGFTAALVLGLAAVFGLMPVGRRVLDVGAALKATGRIAGGARHAVRQMIVIAEVAAAVILLASAGLVGRSFVRLLQVDPGFDTSHLLTLETNAIGARYPTKAAVFAFREATRDAARAVPGVTNAALTNQLPLSGNVDKYNVLDPENIPANPELAPNADRYAVTPEYFTTMRIPVITGRAFTAQDEADTTDRVAIVSASLEQALWPHGTAVGHRIRIGGVTGTDYQVIGVVGDVRHDGLDAGVSRQWYIPMRQGYAERQNVIVLRTVGDPVAIMASVRSAVTAVDPLQPITWMVTMEQMIHRSTAQRRLALVLFAALAAAALLLALAGIYGVLAGNVAERTREFGVRSALGATPGEIVALIVRQGGRLAAVGLGVGVLGAVGTSRFLRSLLYGLTPTDPPTFAAVIVFLALATLIACLIPARRAARVDAAHALRGE